MDEIKEINISDACIGCGACTRIASKIFFLGEEKAEVLASLKYELLNKDISLKRDLDDAIGACPVKAISKKN